MFDKDIFKESGILNKLNEGDFVMVDWGFNVWDFFIVENRCRYSYFFIFGRWGKFNVIGGGIDKDYC